MKNMFKIGMPVFIILLIMSSALMAKGNGKENDILVKVNFFMEWGQISQTSIEFETKEKPRMERGRILIPLRKIADNLGFDVMYNEKTKQIDLADANGKKIALILNSKKAIVNDKAVELDVPAKIINQITFVPLRFISERFDQVIKWDQAEHTAFIDNFTISTPEYLFNQKTLELSKRDSLGKGNHQVLGKIDMAVDWVSMRVSKTKNGNDVIVINNNTGAPHLFYSIYSIYVSENKIIDQGMVYTLFPGKPVISSDGEKVVISNGKTARIYDDKSGKILYEYDLLNLFKAEQDPNQNSNWEKSYVVLGLGDNYILVRDTFKMLTQIVYLDTLEIVDIYQRVLTKEEQERALIDNGPFGSGDGLTFVEERDGKLIFTKPYLEDTHVKTKHVEYQIDARGH